MRLLDGRHKWGPRVRGQRLMFARTCRVCGRTDEFDTIIPDALADVLYEQLARPNIYRDLFRRMAL